MTTLYKKDSKGKIRFWTILTDGDEIIQRSGEVGTDSPVEHRKKATPKNVGRANETTPEEQAELEMESAIQKKLDKAYFRSKKAAEEEVVINPMLAKKYERQAKKIKWGNEKVPTYAQPKLDGMRCLAFIDDTSITFKSRGGKEIANLDHIKASLDTVKSRIILDGELYAHGLSFQENMKLIKKYRKGETEQVRFHVYDLVSKADYSFRYNYIKRLIERLDSAHVELIDNHLVTSEEQMKELHEKFLSAGYEGTMIRHGTDGYKAGGRSDKLLKYKQFLDEQYRVIDIIPSDAIPEHGIVVCTTASNKEAVGQIFKASLKGSHDEREELLTNKNEYIGQQAEIRFFEKTDGGLPRFPVCVGFRL